MTRIYIAGPMTGIARYNFPAFARAAAELRADGHEVVSPHELHGGDVSKTWSEYLRADLAALLTCDQVTLLPGWESSKGATLERHVADALGMPCTEIRVAS